MQNNLYNCTVWFCEPDVDFCVKSTFIFFTRISTSVVIGGVDKHLCQLRSRSVQLFMLNNFMYFM
jgi:hypothetical protein